MAETPLPGEVVGILADTIVARGVAEHLAAELPDPPRVTTYEINLSGNMIADSSPPVLQALRVSRRRVMPLTAAASGPDCPTSTSRERAAGLSTN